MLAPFPIDPALTAVAVAYRNAEMIADRVLPRVPVATQAFEYPVYALADGFTLPETRVGRKSRPAEVEFGFTMASSATEDFALDDPIPAADVANAAASDRPDPEVQAAQNIADLIALGREVRTANLVFNLATYPAAQRATLSGTSQWSDPDNSNPVDAILTALDTMVMRANVMVIGQPVWTKLRQHPKVVKGVFGFANDAGVVTLEQVAALLEIQEIIVGKARVNTAKKGQTPATARTWGKHCALLHRDGMATAQGGRATFGFTGEWGSRVSGAIEDKDIGMRGGLRVRVGESVKEVVTANDLGYFFENAVA